MNNYKQIVEGSLERAQTEALDLRHRLRKVENFIASLEYGLKLIEFKENKNQVHEIIARNKI